MSGYSPTWTAKGSDKLRNLQVTKILMNTIERLLHSLDLSDDSARVKVEEVIAGTIFDFFTPHKDLSLSSQYELLLEILGWKLISINQDSDSLISLNLGANRFIDKEVNNIAYNTIIAGIARSLGYFLFETDVKVDLMSNQFDPTQLTALIESTSSPIPSISREGVGVQVTTSDSQMVATQPSSVSTGSSTPAVDSGVVEVKPELELSVKSIFTPILQGYSSANLLPIFHKVLSELVTSFFSDLEDSQVVSAKNTYSEINTIFLIEFILRSVSTAEKEVSEIGILAGQYLIKALLSKSSEDLTPYLPKELLSDISRRVSYVEFGARDYCSYAPGERCVEGKRDLCDFVLYLWQGILDSLIPDKRFKLGERIPATRRGKFCLVEFIKES